MLAVDVVTEAGPAPRSRWRRRWSLVLVAFVAAVCVLVGPAQTEAKALTIPPIVAAVGEEGALPVSILEFNPVGFGITAAVGLGWLAYENRSTLAKWGQEAWCWLGGSGCGAGDHSSGNTAAGPPSSGGYDDEVTYTIKAGADPGTVTLTNTCIILQTQYHVDFCHNSQGVLDMGTPKGSVVCRGPGGAVINGTVMGPSWYSGGQQVGNLPGVPQPRTWINDGSEFYVCPSGYMPARITWFDNGGASTKVDPGTWTDGSPVPTESRVDVVCKSPSGNVYTVQGPVTADPGDGSAGVTNPLCTPGDTALNYVINSRAAGDANWSTQSVPLSQAPLDQVGNYPDCLNADGSSKGCVTNVRVNGTVCKVGNVGDCWDWKSEEATGAKVDCVWGPADRPDEYVMLLSDCDPLGEAYRNGTYASNDGGQTWYSANPDGSPSTDAGSAPNPWSPQAPPANAPGNNPGGDPSTNTGANPDENCWASIISWNPVDWVETPVKCALSWAFVPSAADWAADTEAARDSWNGTGLSTWINGVSGWVGGFHDPGGSCQGPPVTFSTPFLGSQTFYPLSWCSEPAHTARTVIYVAASFGVVLGAVFVCLRLLGAAFGLNIGFLGRSGGGDES